MSLQLECKLLLHRADATPGKRLLKQTFIVDPILIHVHMAFELKDTKIYYG